MGKGLIRNIGLYALGNVLNGAIPFLLLPVLTRHLSQAEYGILGNLQLLLGLIMPLSGLSTGTALGRYYFDLKKDEYNKMVFNYLFVLFTTSIFIIGAFIILDPYLGEKLDLPPNVIWIVGLIALSKQVIQTLLVTYRVTEKPIGFSLVRISSTAFDFALSIILVLMVYESWEGRFYGQLLAYGGFAIISVLLLFRNKWLTFKLDYQSIKKMIQFGVPLIPHAFGGMLLAFGDRWIITNELGLESAGVYFVGYQVGMIMSLIQTSFNQAWSPWFYKNLNNPTKEIKLKIVRITYLYSIGLFVLAFIIYLFIPFIFDIFIDSKFHDADSFIIWILLGYAFNGVYKMMVNYLLYLKRTRYIGIITLLTAILNIALNFILIPKYNITGAAIATTISFAFQLLVIGFLAVHSYKMPWNLK